MSSWDCLLVKYSKDDAIANKNLPNPREISSITQSQIVERGSRAKKRKLNSSDIDPMQGAAFETVTHGIMKEVATQTVCSGENLHERIKELEHELQITRHQLHSERDNRQELPGQKLRLCFTNR